MDKVKEELNIKQKTSTPSFLIKTYDILEVYCLLRKRIPNIMISLLGLRMVRHLL